MMESVKIQIPDTSVILTSCDRIHSICQWMFDQLNLTYFDYGRYYNNGQSFHLVNDEKGGSNRSFIQRYYSEGVYVTLEECEQLRKLYNNPLQMMTFFSSDLTVTDRLPNRIKHYDNIQLGKQYGIDKRFYLGTKYREYIEIVGFGVGPHHNNFYNACLQTVSVLQGFIQYFRQEAQDIIKEAEKCTIRTSFPTNFSEGQHPHLFTRYDFIKKCKGDIGLTDQEATCLIELAQGSSSKKIEELLSISPRMLKIYTGSIKKKLGCSKISDLLEVFFNITYG